MRSNDGYPMTPSLPRISHNLEPIESNINNYSHHVTVISRLQISLTNPITYSTALEHKVIDRTDLKQYK